MRYNISCYPKCAIRYAIGEKCAIEYGIMNVEKVAFFDDPMDV